MSDMDIYTDKYLLNDRAWRKRYRQAIACEFSWVACIARCRRGVPWSEPGNGAGAEFYRASAVGEDRKGAGKRVIFIQLRDAELQRGGWFSL